MLPEALLGLSYHDALHNSIDANDALIRMAQLIACDDTDYNEEYESKMSQEIAIALAYVLEKYQGEEKNGTILRGVRVFANAVSVLEHERIFADDNDAQQAQKGSK